MLVVGDAKCLHCGFVMGRWVGPKSVPLTVGGLQDNQAGITHGAPNNPVRCGRCAGPVFLDDVTLVTSSYRLRRILRLREQIAAIDADGDRAA